jgi:long-subunit acyl-CoA synthetase (AMP-forming)
MAAFAEAWAEARVTITTMQGERANLHARTREVEADLRREETARRLAESEVEQAAIREAMLQAHIAQLEAQLATIVTTSGSTNEERLPTLRLSPGIAHVQDIEHEEPR